jgi:hypothetical protein
MNRLLMLGSSVAVVTMGCLVPTADGDAGVDNATCDTATTQPLSVQLDLTR